MNWNTQNRCGCGCNRNCCICNRELAIGILADALAEYAENHTCRRNCCGRNTCWTPCRPCGTGMTYNGNGVVYTDNNGFVITTEIAPENRCCRYDNGYMGGCGCTR